MSYIDTLVLSETTVATIFFVIFPIILQLKGENVHISQGLIDSIRGLLIIFLTEIAILLAALHFQNFPIIVPISQWELTSDIFSIGMSIAFFLALVMMLRVGYKLLIAISTR